MSGTNDIPKAEEVNKPKESPIGRFFTQATATTFSTKESRATGVIFSICFLFGAGFLIFNSMQKEEKVDLHSGSKKGSTTPVIPMQDELSEEEIAQFVENEEEKRLDARSKNQSYTPIKIDSVKWASLDSERADQLLVSQTALSAAEKAYSDSSSIEEAVSSAIDAAIDHVEQLGMSRDESLATIARAGMRAAEQLGMDMEEAIITSSAALFDHARERNLSESQAYQVVAQAAMNTAKERNLPVEQQINLASKAAYNAAIQSGKSKKEARAIAAKAAYKAALDANIDREEARKLVAKATYKRAIEGGLKHENALKATTAAMYEVSLDEGSSKKNAMTTASVAVQELLDEGITQTFADTKFSQKMKTLLDSNMSADAALEEAAKATFLEIKDSGTHKLRSALITLNSALKEIVVPSKKSDTALKQSILDKAPKIFELALRLDLDTHDALNGTINASENLLSLIIPIFNKREPTLVGVGKTLNASEMGIYEGILSARFWQSIKPQPHSNRFEIGRAVSNSKDEILEIAIKTVPDKYSLHEILGKAVYWAVRAAIHGNEIAQVEATKLSAWAAYILAKQNGKTEREAQSIATAASLEMGEKLGLSRIEAEKKAVLAISNVVRDEAIKQGASEEKARELANDALSVAANALSLSPEATESLIAESEYITALEKGDSESKATKKAKVSVQKFLRDRGMSAAEAKARAEIAASGISNSSTTQATPRSLSKLTYDLAVSEGATNEEAILAAGNAAYSQAIRKGLSEEEANEARAKAIFDLTLDNGGTEEEAIAAVIAFEEERLIKDGKTKEQARKQAAAIAANVAVDSGVSRDEANALVSSAVLRREVAASGKASEAINLGAETAFNLALLSGSNKEEAIKAAADFAYQSALQNGATEEEAILAAAKAVEEIGKKNKWTTKEIIAQASSVAHKLAVEAEMEADEITLIAGLAAGEAAKSLGLSEKAITHHTARGAIKSAEMLNLPVERAAAAGIAASKKMIEKLSLGEQKEATLLNSAKKSIASWAGTTVEKIGSITKADDSSGQASTSQNSEPPSRTPEQQRETNTLSMYLKRKKKERELAEEGKGEKYQSRPKYTPSDAFMFGKLEVAVKSEDTGSVSDAGSKPIDLGKTDALPTGSPASGLDKPKLATGERIQAYIESTINTDHAGNEVVLTIMGGVFNGGTAIGVYGQPHKWGSSIGLNVTEIFHNGKTYTGLKFQAINPESSSPAFASKVDHHRIERYTSTVLSALSRGYLAEAVAQRETETIRGGPGESTSDISKAAGPKLAKQIGISTAVNEISKIGDEHATRPKTIHVNIGDPVILIALKPIYEKQ